MDYKEKIRKLLALAESPNENEAKEALLKAREIMAKHKLSFADVEKKVNEEIKEIEVKDITFSSRKNLWIKDIAFEVATHYCCKSILYSCAGKQTHTVCFVGVGDDVELCSEIFKYAVESVFSQITRIIQNSESYLTSKDMKLIRDSYGLGFAEGLSIAFSEQEEKNPEWGLVLLVPAQVNEYLKSINAKPKKFKTKNIQIEKNVFNKGLVDGENFNPSRRIKSGG